NRVLFSQSGVNLAALRTVKIAPARHIRLFRKLCAVDKSDRMTCLCQTPLTPRAALPLRRRAGLLLTPNCQRPSALSRHTEFTTESPDSCECLRKSEMETSLVLSLGGGVIAPRSRPGSPGGARPDARRLPATGLGWRRRNGPATGPRPASATALASSRRCSPAARRPRPAHRRSRLCPRGTTARCTPPGAGNCPARILRSSLRVTNPAVFDPQPDRATAPPPAFS